MITAAEGVRLATIKAKVLAGKYAEVPASDKQWVLDVTARESVVIRKGVAQRAAAEGFNVAGIRCK